MEPRLPAANRLKTKMAMTIMAEDRDSPKDIAPRFKYAIFSQPRSGSTALAEFLAVRKFGDPVEFINMNYIQAYCRIRGITEVGINDYLNHLFRRRSSPNGVFGIKIHVNQFTAIAQQGKQDTGAVARDIMGRFDKIVIMKRRNKLHQTSSYYRAIETDTWTPAQDRGGPVADTYGVYCVDRAFGHGPITGLRCILREIGQRLIVLVDISDRFRGFEASRKLRGCRVRVAAIAGWRLISAAGHEANHQRQQ